MSQVPMIAPLGYSLLEVHRLSNIQRCIQTLDQEENTRGFYQVLTVMLFLVGCEFLSLVNLTLTHHSLHLYHLLCLFFGVWRFENLCNNNKTVAMLAHHLCDWLCNTAAAEDDVDLAMKIFSVSFLYHILVYTPPTPTYTLYTLYNIQNSFVFVFLWAACPFITLIICLECLKSIILFFVCQLVMSLVSESPIELIWTAKNSELMS